MKKLTEKRLKRIIKEELVKELTSLGILKDEHVQWKNAERDVLKKYGFKMEARGVAVKSGSGPDEVWRVRKIQTIDKVAILLEETKGRRGTEKLVDSVVSLVERNVDMSIELERALRTNGWTR
jgi:hypothetical protein